MANNLFRHLKLYFHLVKFAAMLETEYRFSFLLEILVEVAFFVATLASYSVIFTHVPTIAGWNRYQIMVLYGLNMILSETILGFVFIFNLRELPHKIVRGELDLILTKPVNSLFAATLWRPYFASIPSSLSGLVLTLYGYHQGHLPFHLSHFFLFILFFSCGHILAYSIGTIISCLSFWFNNAEPLPYLAQQFIFLAKHPYDIYQGIWRLIFLVVIPTAFMLSFPTQALFGQLSAYWLLPAIILAVGFLKLTSFVWAMGLKVYESASI